MIAILPACLAADDTSAAILRGNGGVLLNGNPAPPSAALFPRDTVETQPKAAVARIELTGSAIDINPETLVEFEGDEIVLEHGSVSVNTSRAFKVRVGCLIVTPANPAWTRYDVTDVDGKVTVAALKSDVNIDSRSSNLQQAKRSTNAGRVSVREGEQKSREEKCGAANFKSPDAAARDGIMNSPYTVGVAAGVAVGLTCWALCRSDNPASPSVP